MLSPSRTSIVSISMLPLDLSYRGAGQGSKDVMSGSSQDVGQVMQPPFTPAQVAGNRPNVTTG